MPIQKLEVDKKLIKALFNCEPLDWTRRPNGDLVYLNEIGQKFILPEEEIRKLTDAALARKRRTEPAEAKPEAAPAKKTGLAPNKKAEDSAAENKQMKRTD